MRDRRQPGPLLRPARARRRHAAPRTTPGRRSSFDPWRQETLGRQRHRADRRSRAPTPTSAPFFAPPAGRPTTCPTLARAARRRRARRRRSRPRRPKTAVHAGTPDASPTLDALGRTFLTVAHNRFERDTPPTVDEERYATRVVLDIEGNQRERHRRARTASSMRYDYDMLGSRHPPGQHGGRRALDAERRRRQAAPRLGQPRPPVPHRVRRAAPADRVASCATATGAETAGRRAPSTARAGPTRRPQPARQGRRSSSTRPASSPATRYDFKGNLLRSQPPARAGLQDDARLVGRRRRWSRDLHQQHDATTRSTARSTVTTPDGSVVPPDVQRGQPARAGRRQPARRRRRRPRRSSTDIDYDAKGQRDADRLRQRRRRPRTPTTR